MQGMEAPSQQLYWLLLNSRTRTSCGRFIILDEKLGATLTRERIRPLLLDELRVAPHLVEETTDTVRCGAIKILAILICIGRVGTLLSHFIYRGVTDARLPLLPPDLPPEFAEAFSSEQQHFLSPVLTRGIFRDWGSEVILPFAVDEPVGEDASGSYATVHKIEIISPYQRLTDAMDRSARKVSS